MSQRPVLPIPVLDCKYIYIYVQSVIGTIYVPLYEDMMTVHHFV
jgi:hypothetical protein